MAGEMSLRGALVELPRVRHLPDWRSWQQLTADGPPFLTPEFFTLELPFADDPAVVAEAWDGDRLVGALPLVRSGDRLSALRSPYTPRYDYAGSHDGVEAIWRALLADPSWNELAFARVPAGSLLATRLAALAAEAGCPSVVRVDARPPYFPLAGFEARLSPKFKTNLQRCARKLGGVELERIGVPDREAFDQALEIEAMAWKRAAGTSIQGDEKGAHLYRAMAKLFGRRGQGALYFLRAGGKRIATMLAIEDGHTLYALKIGYDPEYANTSPGHLIVWKIAQEAEARGLRELDFVGRNDDWKRKWTELAHEYVALVIYRANAAGLARYALRHVVKPQLPESLRGGWREAWPRQCQQDDVVGVHSLTKRIRGRLAEGLGIKSGVRRLLRPPPATDRLGAPSAFAPGSWVKVKDKDALRATLDGKDRTRGLVFVPAQWDTAGKAFQVVSHVRRIRDDHGRMRAVHRTVLLAGVDCSGSGPHPAGCGRHCPMMYRDEWLEPAEAPHASAPVVRTVHARVRELDDIKATLDVFGRRDGVTFMPEMAVHVGKRYGVAGVMTMAFEYDHWAQTRAPLYMLDGARCTGAVTGSKGPCDRACTLLWHPDWLIVES